MKDKTHTQTVTYIHTRRGKDSAAHTQPYRHIQTQVDIHNQTYREINTERWTQVQSDRATQTFTNRERDRHGDR